MRYPAPSLLHDREKEFREERAVMNDAKFAAQLVDIQGNGRTNPLLFLKMASIC